jgi:Flp pilus assembly protein TadD
MDVDGPHGDKGTYAIAPLRRTTVVDDEQVITWNSFKGKPGGHKTIGFLSQISPDGTYAVTTLNEAIYVTNFTDYRFLQVFYPTGGILAWYSKETGEMKPLPGADDADYVQCQPAWFPDGSELVFARAKAFDPRPPGLEKAMYAGDPKEPRIQYDLYRIPFDNGKGGTPVPVEGASANGMSNTFPKVSPDGKWIVFTKCANGQLIRPDSRLWIVSTEGGPAREMRCNTSLMNSWHSFSPNGRWLVFSSKSNTPYTQMFLTHIDEDGNDTPPILIPHSTAANRAVNIPEFVNTAYDDFDAIDVPAVNHHRDLQRGMSLLAEGRHEEASAFLERALKKEPEFSRALLALGFARMEMGRLEDARKLFRKAIELDPRMHLAHVNLGLTFLREGKTGEAVGHFRRAVELDPLDPVPHHDLGIALLRQGNIEDALKSQKEAARLEPANASIRNSLGWNLQAMGRLDEAIAEYRAAVEQEPGHRLARSNLAAALDARGLRGEALKHMQVLLELTPDDSDLRLRVAWALATLPGDGLRDGKRAVSLAERCREAVGDRADVLDVLAAAYAEAGRFEEAVKAASRAKALAASGDGKVASGLDERLEGYRARRPHRQK